jgi:hypothetical protein
VIYLLEREYAPEDFDGNRLQFRIYRASDFAQPMEAGVSLFLYRIYTNGVHRTPTGRVAADGQRFRNQLPVDMHFLLTAWAQDASLQHTITGWMMRILEDTPSFPAGLLNQKFASVFHGDETVEISVAELTTEELFRIWDVIGNNSYQISVPYVARNVKIESTQFLSRGQPVQQRIFNMGELRSSESEEF